MINVLKTLYPDFDWKTKYKSRSYWKSLDNQRVFLNQIRSSLGMKNLNDWKNIFNVQFYKAGAGILLDMYGGSFIKVLKTLYPNHQWKDKDKDKIESEYLTNLDNQCTFLNRIGHSLGIKTLEDWNNVTTTQFYQADCYKFMMDH
jgi:hypothetical protein